MYLELLGRSLMIGWRKNSWNPERAPSVVTFVCVRLSVRPLAGCRTHCLAQEPNFWVKWSLGHEKKRIFFSRNFHFYAFYRFFSIFSLYDTSKCLVSSYQAQFFHLGMWYLCWEDLARSYRQFDCHFRWQMLIGTETKNCKPLSTYHILISIKDGRTHTHTHTHW